MRLNFTIILTLSACSFHHLFAKDPAATVLIQPEIRKVNNDVVRQLDEEALGGEYVTHMSEYHPLFFSSLEVVAGDPLILWARLRGLAVQAKAVKDNSQEELNWNWESPAAWKWVKIGEYARKALGTGVLLIRGPNAAQDAGLDAVILTSDTAFAPDQASAEELEELTIE